MASSNQVPGCSGGGSTIGICRQARRSLRFFCRKVVECVYGVHPKVAEHFDIEWHLLSDHGSIVGSNTDRTVQVSLDWQATKVRLRVRVISTDPSCEYKHEAVVTYAAGGCEAI